MSVMGCQGTLCAATHLAKPRALGVWREVGQEHVAGGPLSTPVVTSQSDSHRTEQRAESKEGAQESAVGGGGME